MRNRLRARGRTGRRHQVLVRLLLKDAQQVEHVEQQILVGDRQLVDEDDVLLDRRLCVEWLVGWARAADVAVNRRRGRHLPSGARRTVYRSEVLVERVRNDRLLSRPSDGPSKQQTSAQPRTKSRSGGSFSRTGICVRKRRKMVATSCVVCGTVSQSMYLPYWAREDRRGGSIKGRPGVGRVRLPDAAHLGRRVKERLDVLHPLRAARHAERALDLGRFLLQITSAAGRSRTGGRLSVICRSLKRARAPRQRACPTGRASGRTSERRRSGRRPRQRSRRSDPASKS
jgi:hypothetical protein